VDEFQIINKYFLQKNLGSGVILGIGDDGAAISHNSSSDLITVVDTIIAGVHYPKHIAAEDVGYRALAVNLSDIAAMGAKPRWMTLALTLSSSDDSWLKGFAKGFFELAQEFNVNLVGGDTTKGSETVITVNILGEVQKGKILKRSGAKAGDSIYVSGTLGDAAAGLFCLKELQEPFLGSKKFLVDRFLRPSPRLELGCSILNSASSCIDLSDGLYADLFKLLDSSGVSGIIEMNDLPISKQIVEVIGREKAVYLALSGGDDYELCFTSSDDFISESDLKVTKIGTVTNGSGLSCRLNGSNFAFHSQGYRHFS
tara:strand:+ start:210 stop:1148 length:939 start_codon:yes stop_codon:yes gene_type:complete